MKKDSEKVEMLTEPSESSSSLPTQKEPPPVTFKKSATPLWVWILLGLASMLFLAGLITLVIAVTKGSKPCPNGRGGNGGGSGAVCYYSAEANRSDLPGFLKKVQSEYYALNAHQVAWQPDVEIMDDHVRER